MLGLLLRILCWNRKRMKRKGNNILIWVAEQRPLTKCCNRLLWIQKIKVMMILIQISILFIQMIDAVKAVIRMLAARKWKKVGEVEVVEEVAEAERKKKMLAMTTQSVRRKGHHKGIAAVEDEDKEPITSLMMIGWEPEDKK